MSKKQESPQNPLSPFDMTSSRIDLVKELIFGDDLATTRKALQELEERLDSESSTLSQKLEMRLKELEEKISVRLQALESKTQSEINRLSDEKANRMVLGKMLEDLGKSLQNG